LSAGTNSRRHKVDLHKNAMRTPKIRRQEITENLPTSGPLCRHLCRSIPMRLNVGVDFLAHRWLCEALLVPWPESNCFPSI
jgi:hypothetical protein